MKYFAVSLLTVMMIASAAQADLTKGSQTLTVLGGFGGSGSQYNYEPGNQEPVTGGGGAVGAQYLYYFTKKPTFGVGLDYLHSFNGDRHDDDLLNGYDTTQRLKSSIVLAMLKLVYPTGKVRPYIFGGVGFHSSQQTLQAQPQAGVTWPGGGTETRSLIDESKTGAALGYGIGLDFFPVESFFFGLELRGTWLGGLDTDDNAALNNAGFTEHENNAISQGNILFRAGVKF